jgi:TolB-like protein
LQHFTLKALIFVALIGVIACSSFHRRKNDPTAFTTWATTAHYSPVVGILSFTNKTNQPDLPELVRAGFYGHFSPLPFNDRELGDIDRTVELLQKNQKKILHELSSKDIGALLGAQALVYGEVTKFTKVYAGVYSQIGVSAKIKIVDSQNGKTLWEDSYDTRFHEGDIPLNQILAVFSLVKTYANIRSTQELRTIDDLCRNLVDRIPKVSFPEDEKGSRSSLCEIQIGAFKDLERARELQEELKNKHYQAFIRTIENHGVVWHSVLIGPFDCGQETDKWREKITTDFGFPAIPIKIDAFVQP